jgi:hypothetical protein
MQWSGQVFRTTALDFLVTYSMPTIFGTRGCWGIPAELWGMGPARR